MKAHRVTMIILDFDNVGEELRDVIENTKYPNRCIAPNVTNIETVELGEWDDSLPINKLDKMGEEFERLHKQQKDNPPKETE